MNQLVAKTSGFALQPTTITEASQMAQMLAGSNMVPNNYKNQSGDILVAMMMGTELGLNPIQALQNIAVINGKPCIYGDALLALVQNHPKFGGITETFNDANMVATCTVWRKGGSDNKHTSTFSQADAQNAQLWDKRGPWQQYPKRMLTMRARGFALRNQFADALLGLITVEEAQDYPTEKDMGRAEIVPETPTYYDPDLFDQNFPAWQSAIVSGKRTNTEIIAMVESKGTLTDDQKNKINDVRVEGE